MSSDGTGAVGEAATEAEDTEAVAAPDTGSADRVTADQAQLADPWFAPEPSAHRQDADGASADAAAAQTAQQAEWFLRTGRAGLMPDAMTVGWDNDDATVDPPADRGVRVEAAGAPPWAGEAADALASAPPPWETGPWPGPGGLSSLDPAATGDAQANGSAVAGGAVNGGPSGRGSRPGTGGASMAGQGRWSARTVVAAGLMPLVVPGLVLGILSLRRPSGPAVRKASWFAIGASMAWAVIIILIVAGTSGGSAPSCGTYPAAVHQAYERALADLSDHAPASVQAADLGTAANLANASAAAAGQIGVRTALFALANDMAEARADVVAQRPVPAALREHLVKDGAPPAGSCAAQ
jgi:hypothetical protein